MPIQQLSYLGINRAVSDYSPSRACEELINLRPTTDGLVPVKPFATKMSNVTFDRVIVHNTSEGANYIAVYRSNGVVKIDLVDESGQNPVNIGVITPDAAGQLDGIVSSLSYASAGNVLLFSVAFRGSAGTTPAAPFFGNYAYLWKGGVYSAIDGTIPELTPTFYPAPTIALITRPLAFQLGGDKYELADAAVSGITAIQEENKGLCFGPILLAFAYKTTDGNTIWTGRWQFYDPIPAVDALQSNRLKVTSADFTAEDFEVCEGLSAFFTKYGYGYATVLSRNEIAGFTQRLYGASVKVTIPAYSSWDEDTYIIQSVEVYASRPVLYADTGNALEGSFVFWDETSGALNRVFCILPPVKYDEMDLDGQLMYFQASIPMKELAGGPQTITLNFGGNIQLTEDTLEVDAGMVQRFGKLLSYNARFHYYDSVSRTKMGMPSLYYAATTYPVAVFAQYDDGEKIETIYCGMTGGLNSNAYFVIAPSLKIKEVIAITDTGTGDFATYSTCYIRKYRMTPSSTYNYAVCTEGSYISGRVMTYDEWLPYRVKISSGVSAVQTEEPNAINVTEQYSPFVFRVEHSYMTPGAVLDVRPQMLATADVSYGDYPLNVFTTQGIYALLQGSSNVLYGALRPLSSLVASGGKRSAVSTESGNFVLAAGNLWLVAGLNIVLVSDALAYGPHPYLRSCTSYQAICGGPGAPNAPQYDVSSLVSLVPFEQYAEGAVLSYNRWRDELLVSNPSYDYTYVLSLKYRQWFKIDRTLWQDSVGGRLASTPTATPEGTGIDVLDLSDELETASGQTTTVLAHLQSRPFSFGYQYSHVHRLVAMMRAAVKHTEKVIVALYGSDDLQGWTLISYAYRTGGTQTVDGQTVDVPLRVSQVRTAPAGRSWRYYTLCIGGIVPTDTDLGPVLLDYQSVIRRIG